MVEAGETRGGKKTRDHPDLSHCHACALLCTANRPRGRLRLLPSEWRVVLLCPPCLAALRSAQLCSYCLSAVDAASHAFLDCRGCSARVHVGCVPREQRYLSPAELGPSSFTCVDCDALPKSLTRRSLKTSLEDVVRDASCAAEKKVLAAAKARENAVEKATVARQAAERARSALNAVLVVHSKDGDLVLPDEELALRLHLAMNGSQRILRSRGSKNSENFPDIKRVRANGESKVSENRCDSVGVCGSIQMCTEDRFFFDPVRPLELDLGSSDFISSENEEQRREVNGQGGNSVIGLFVKDMHSNGDVNSSKLQQKERIAHDRYLKKYSRRKSRLKVEIDRKDYPLVPCWQNCSSEVSRTSADAPCRASIMTVHSSMQANDLASCQ